MELTHDGEYAPAFKGERAMFIVLPSFFRTRSSQGVAGCISRLLCSVKGHSSYSYKKIKRELFV